MTAESKDFNNRCLREDEHYNDVKRNLRRTPTECAVVTVADGKEIGCYPHLYAALAHNLPDHVIFL